MIAVSTYHRPVQSKTTENDFDLIQACIAGSQSAWEALVERNSRLVFTVAVRVGLSREDAEEVHQTVFVRLFKSLATIRDRTCLASWLITTARREAYRVSRVKRPLPATEAMLDRADDAEPRSVRIERQHAVRVALTRLSRKDRELLTALFMAPGSPDYQAVARDQRMKIGSIGPTRARALARLREVLVQMGFDGCGDSALPARNGQAA